MGNFFNNLNDKLAEFMAGRNGSDKLARWTLGAALIFAFINIFAPNIICSVLSYALLAYCLFRMFSRNISARAEENEKFEGLFDKIKGRSSSTGSSHDVTNKSTASQTRNNSKHTDKNKVYFNCDKCGQSLSVPKGRGTLKVTCPKCKHQTTIKS